MNKLSLILILFLANISICKAQDGYGFSYSNYSPTTTVFHNPSNIVDNKVWLDINFFGLGAFVYNNFAYAQGSIFSPSAYNPHAYNLSNKNKDAYVDVEAQVLSAAFQYKEHGIALTNRFRTFMDIRKVPSDFAQLLVTDTDKSLLRNRDVNITNMYITQLSFAEFGLHYTNVVYHFDKDLIAVGGSLNYLVGVAGGGVQIDELRYRLDDNDKSLFFKFDAEYGYAGGWKSGTGLGLSIGATYKKMLDNVTHYAPFERTHACDCYYYKYKLGASILDFGYVNFKKNATYQRIQMESNTEVEDFKAENLMPENVVDFSQDNFTQGVTITNKNQFRMWLPMAFNFQFDYNFENNIYLSAQYMQGWLKRLYLGIERPAVFTINPRYETKWLEAALPLSLYNFEEPRIGVLLRFGGFAIGTDKLGSMVGITGKSYGADIYLHFKYLFWSKPGCKRKTKKRKRNESQCVKF